MTVPLFPPWEELHHLQSLCRFLSIIRFPLILTTTIFLIWRKHILAVIRGHKLQDFIYGATAPPLKFLSLDDENLEIVNKEYIDWEQQDQLLFPWIVSSMTDGILARVVNCESSFQVWRTLELYFAVQIRSKVSQFKPQLNNTRKDSLSMNDYLLKIRH